MSNFELFGWFYVLPVLVGISGGIVALYQEYLQHQKDGYSSLIWSDVFKGFFFVFLPIGNIVTGIVCIALMLDTLRVALMGNFLDSYVFPRKSDNDTE